MGWEWELSRELEVHISTHKRLLKKSSPLKRALGHTGEGGVGAGMGVTLVHLYLYRKMQITGLEQPVGWDCWAVSDKGTPKIVITLRMTNPKGTVLLPTVKYFSRSFAFELN